MKIGILGHYGNHNLGDEAIIEAAIDSVRRHFPGADVSCFSVNPQDTIARHGIMAYPLDWSVSGSQPGGESLESKISPVVPVDNDGNVDNCNQSRTFVDIVKQSSLTGGLYRFFRRTILGLLDLRWELPFLAGNYRRLKEFDLLLVTGSNQFLDNFGGVWGFPYTLLKWVGIAKLAGAKVALVSLGAGPLTSPLSKLFAKTTVRLSDYVSYRDSASRVLVEGVANSYSSRVYPDLASNLTLKLESTTRRTVNNTVIGINPMPMYDGRYWCEPDEDKYRDYVSKLSDTVIALQKAGHHCFLYNTQEQDKLVIDDVLTRIEEIIGGDKQFIVERKDSDTTESLIDVIRMADISVATRFHGAVLSLRCGLPVVGICYHRKIADLLDSMGQGDYKVDLDSFSSNLLVEMINMLIKNAERQKLLIRERSDRNETLVEEQYEFLAHLFLI